MHPGDFAAKETSMQTTSRIKPKPGAGSGGSGMLVIFLLLLFIGLISFPGCGPQPEAPPPSSQPAPPPAPSALESMAKMKEAAPPGSTQGAPARPAPQVDSFPAPPPVPSASAAPAMMKEMKEAAPPFSTRGAPVRPAPSPSPRPAPARTSPQADSFKAIDRIMEEMQPGNIAFNVPAAINLQETASIHLVLSLQKPVEALKQMVQAEGEKEGTSIRITNRMEARLTGPNFQIQAITPEVQAVTATEITEWKWVVKPTQLGQHHLHLTLTALFSVDGVPTSRMIRTFDKTIEVNVTLAQQATALAHKFGPYLWAGLIPLAGWFWKWRRRKKLQAKVKKPEA
jgi:hypothetical protein